MIRTNKNSLNVIIASKGVAAASLPAVGTVITNQNLPAGATVLVDNGMRRLQSSDLTVQGGTVARVKIAKSLGSSKPLVITHDFNLETSKVTFKKFVRATEQVTAIGFNPKISSGALPSAANTHYYINIDKLDNDPIHRSKYSAIMFDATTNASGDQGVLATDLAANAAKNISKFAESNKYMKAYAVTDATATILTGTTDTANITQGSKVLTNAGAELLTGVTTGGINLISFPATAADGTSVDRVYQVESVDTTANTVTVTQPILEATATGVTVEDATAGSDFGVILEMTRNTFDNYKMRDYQKNRINVIFSESFTPVTEMQAASEGVGNGEQALWDEFIGMGIEGQKEIFHAPSIRREETANLSSTYGVININYSESMHELVNNDKAKGNVLVYIELDGANPSAITASSSEALLADLIFDGNAAVSSNTSSDLDE